MANVTLQTWQAVPTRVAALLPEAARVKCAHIDAARTTGLLPVSLATWQPETNHIAVYVFGTVEKTAVDAYQQKIAPFAVTVKNIETAQPDIAQEILIKRAGIPVIAPAVDFTQKALGGPNPLTNTLVASLLAGGLGYGAGTIMEQLFPERYLERGKLRKNLGLLGALGGVGFGAMNAYSNARNNMTGTEFYKAPFRNFMRGYLMRNDAPPLNVKNAPAAHDLNDLTPSRSILDETPKYAAFGMNNNFNASGLYTPMIPVQQFNQSVWQDTQRGMVNGFQQHTPPAYAAATTGLMSGLSAGTQSPIIRPIDVIHGIASAGVGLATANLAGRALSALAGLTPEGQAKLQDLGLFGGMMHAIVPTILGVR